MERHIIFAFLLLACISCRPKQQECQLNDQFICFAETGEKGEILKGVRRIADGQILIQPGSYLSVTADSCFIVAQKGTYSFEVWKTDGTRIGKFDTFTGFKRGYYIGTKYRTTTLYFPRYDLLLRSEQVQQGKHALCIRVDSTFKEKDAIIDRQRKQISLLDRKANPQRYSLSSGAELVRINVSNYRNPSLHIWTRVGEELFEDTKFQIDYDVPQRHFNGQITDEEFVNAVFDPQEQVNGKQAELLGAVFTLAAGGPAEVHVGTGGGGSSSELPWRDKDKYSKKSLTRRR